MKNMKPRLFLTLAAAIMVAAVSSCGNSRSSHSTQAESQATDISSLGQEGGVPVYMTRDLSAESIVRIYHALGRPAVGRVALKISTNEMQIRIT